jgi:hypothetical protein
MFRKTTTVCSADQKNLIGRNTSLCSNHFIVGWTIGIRSPTGATKGLILFILVTAFGTALGPTQLHIQWVPGVKATGREVVHASPSSAEVKCVELYHHPPYVFMAWGFVKLRGNFTFLHLPAAMNLIYSH